MAFKHKTDPYRVDEDKRLRPGHEAFKELGMIAPRGRARPPVANPKARVTLRLSRIFGTTAEFWMNLQMGYDLSVTAKAEARELKKIKAIAA